jgi:hypothetical protein
MTGLAGSLMPDHPTDDRFGEATRTARNGMTLKGVCSPTWGSSSNRGPHGASGSPLTSAPGRWISCSADPSTAISGPTCSDRSAWSTPVFRSQTDRSTASPPATGTSPGVSRVAGGNRTPGSHGTGREPLDSSGSYRSVGGGRKQMPVNEELGVALASSV